MKKLKIIYGYDPDTHAYTGEEMAQIDPLETAAAGETVWIPLPATTHTSPPETPAGKIAVYRPDTDDWDVVDKDGAGE